MHAPVRLALLPRNMLELLPDEFTKKDLAKVRLALGCKDDDTSTSNQIYQWVHRELILQLTADSYKKVPKK